MFNFKKDFPLFAGFVGILAIVDFVLSENSIEGTQAQRENSLKSKQTSLSRSHELRKNPLQKKDRVNLALESNAQEFFDINTKIDFLDFESSTELYISLQNLSEAELEQALSLADKITTSPARKKFILMVYTLWAQHNPQAALKHNLSYGGAAKHKNESAIIKIWANHDANAVFDWLLVKLENQPLNSLNRKRLFEDLFKVLTQQSFAKALASFTTLESKYQNLALRGILNGATKAEQYESLVTTFKDNQHNQLLNETLTYWRNESLKVFWSGLLM